MVTLQWIVVGIAASFLCLQQCDAVYYGTKIGDFANRFHQVKGEVYAVDSRTLFIKVNIGPAQLDFACHKAWVSRRFD